MVSTVFLSHKMERTTLKFISVLIDGLAFVLLAFLPQDMDPFVALYPIFLLLHFNGVPSKVPMVLTAPASSPPTISVSVRQDLQSTFTAEIPKHSEEVSSMEKCFFPFISELQCASCSAPDSIWQAHGQDFSRYAPHSSLSMRNALFQSSRKRGGSQGSRLRASFLVLINYCFSYAAASSADVSCAVVSSVDPSASSVEVSSTEDSRICKNPSARSAGTPACLHVFCDDTPVCVLDIFLSFLPHYPTA